MDQKKHSLTQAKDFLAYTQKVLEVIIDQDLRKRKTAKPSAKPKWSKAIKKTQLALESVKQAKRIVKTIRLRV